jgi:hypothetical protein
VLADQIHDAPASIALLDVGERFPSARIGEEP